MQKCHSHTGRVHKIALTAGHRRRKECGLKDVAVQKLVQTVGQSDSRTVGFNNLFSLRQICGYKDKLGTKQKVDQDFQLRPRCPVCKYPTTNSSMAGHQRHCHSLKHTFSADGTVLDSIGVAQGLTISLVSIGQEYSVTRPLQAGDLRCPISRCTFSDGDDRIITTHLKRKHGFSTVLCSTKSRGTEIDEGNEAGEADKENRRRSATDMANDDDSDLRPSKRSRRSALQPITVSV
jgi:hypothetical protein